jgi:hypothetical protein
MVAVAVAAGCDGDDSRPSLPGESAATGPVTVPAPAPPDQQGRACRALLAQLPDRVIGLGSRPTESQGAAAAWGDPPVILRCGVDKPAALRPTSFCFVVDDVGWLTTVGGSARPPTSPTDRTQVFTTIGRSPSVDLTVPGDYADDAPAALADVAATVRATTSVDPDTCL